MSKSGIVSKVGVAKINPDLGKGRFFRQLIRSFRTAGAQLTNREEQKGLFYESENFTQDKFG